MLTYGDHGTGKSHYALNAMYLKNEQGKPFRVLFIDNENGSIDDYCTELERDGINTENLLIVYTTSLVETKEYIKKATNKENFLDEDGSVILDADGQPFRPDMIVVDGTTILHKTTIQGRREFSKKRASVRADKKEGINALEKFVMVDGADIELKDYNQVNFEGQSLVLDLTASGLHYIITAREVEVFDKKIIEVNGQKKEINVSTGQYKPEGFKGMDFNVKTVARMYHTKDGDPTVKMMVTKDRTGTYEPFVEIEDPSILDYQAMIDRNANKANFVLANNMHEDIKKEMEKIERETLGTTIEESPIVNVEPSGEEELAKKRAEASSEMRVLTPGQKTKFGELLAENGLPRSSSKLETVADCEKYIALCKSVVNA